MHGGEYPSNRVARCMQQACISGTIREESGRPDDPLCGILDSDFGELAFYEVG